MTELFTYDRVLENGEIQGMKTTIWLDTLHGRSVEGYDYVIKSVRCVRHSGQDTWKKLPRQSVKDDDDEDVVDDFDEDQDDYDPHRGHAPDDQL